MRLGFPFTAERKEDERMSWQSRLPAVQRKLLTPACLGVWTMELAASPCPRLFSACKEVKNCF